MKKVIALFILFISIGAIAQPKSPFSFGVLADLDIGAVVPWPLTKAVGGGDKLNVVPRVSPGVGIWGEYKFADRWSVALEATYKTTGMDASIITLNSGQKFKDDGLDVVFYGRARTSIFFSMVEVPLFVKFKINEHNTVFLGVYYAHIVDGKFEAAAINGRLENPNIPGEVTIVKPEAPVNQDFSANLSNWDIGWQVGYERKIWKNFLISGRISVGSKDIFKQNENYLDYSMWQMRGTLSVAYKIF